MTQIDIAQIDKLAELSRIALTDTEKVAMQKDISSILGYVDQIQAISETAPSRAPQKVRNIMREDIPRDEGGTFTTAILANAPKHKDGYIEVKKILGSSQ
jgi:aspartyl-tRNA(Asn)/glutamyl-tRNA(Gln) amidotransferase subunit C